MSGENKFQVEVSSSCWTMTATTASKVEYDDGAEPVLICEMDAYLGFGFFGHLEIKVGQ